MTKLQIFITVFVISIFAILFFFLQQNNSASSTPPLAVTPTIEPFITDTFQAKVNLTPQPQQQNQGAQTNQPNTQQVETLGPLDASISATIKTAKGDIQITLFGDKAENTVRNFITKAKSGYYRNLIFHRVEDWVIQGGDPRGNGTGGGQMLTEPNDEPFVAGSLGIARGGDPRISNDSQFFITKNEASHLNKQYTNFGMVTKGMDVVNKIQIGDKILGISVAQ
jgi:peptidyl-prolyl cis-trans isomerase B (cyclophilin B)